jgi:thiol-disulfide isomerase/thioredoxin
MLILRHLLLVCIALFSACKAHDENGNGYDIQGKVESVSKGATIFLEEVIDNQFVKRDSTKLGSDSMFHFTGKVTEPGFYRVLLDNNQFVYVVLDNQEKVTIKFASNPNIGNSYTIKGSKQNDYLQEMNFMEANFQEQTRELSELHQKANHKKDSAGVLDAELRYETLFQSYKKQYKAFIDTAQTSIVVLMIANSSPCLSFDDDLLFLEKLAQKYNKELPQSRYTKQFIERVATAKKVAVGSIAPDFSIPLLNKKSIKLSSLRGKVILVDFWASWCGPCRAENPNVVKVYQDFKDKGFDILGVSLDNDVDAWQEAIKKDKLTWQHGADLEGWESEIVKQYSITGIPFTLLIDQKGKIIAKNLRGEQLREKLKAYLK